MTRRTLLAIALLILAPVVRAQPVAPAAQQPAASRLPVRLSGAEFFKLITELSEPDGYFRSDNLVSNELFMQRVIPELTRTVKPGPRLSRRRPRTELHLYRGHQAGDGVHHRRPARQPAAAPDVQGALRAVGGPRRLRVPALLDEAPDRAGPQVDGAGNLRCLRRPAACAARTSTSRTSARSGASSSARTALRTRRRTSRASRRSTRTFYTRGLDIHYEVTPGSAGSFPTYAEMMVSDR